MCEKCEDRDRMKKISCALCSTGTIKPTDEIENVNREVTDPKAVMEKIDEEMKRQHKEAINGYDKQVEDCLRDLANFSTKMLIMFEDYKKKGDVTGMRNLLESMRNYGMLSQTTSSVLVTTLSMLVEKLQSFP